MASFLKQSLEVPVVTIGAAGNEKEVQFNNNGVIHADTKFTYDDEVSFWNIWRIRRFNRINF
jgi:hypothetical protein